MNIREMEEAIEDQKKATLRANGWKYSMFHYYWVWRKTHEGVDHMQFSIDNALNVERILQELNHD